MNKHASALGKLARGVKKNFSPAERARRRRQMAVNRAKRWEKKEGK